MGVTFNPFSGTFDFTGTGGSSSGIGGSIADTQIAFGTGVNTIGGESTFTYDSATNILTVERLALSGGSGATNILSLTQADDSPCAIEFINATIPSTTTCVYVANDGSYHISGPGNTSLILGNAAQDVEIGPKLSVGGTSSFLMSIDDAASAPGLVVNKFDAFITETDLVAGNVLTNLQVSTAYGQGAVASIGTLQNFVTFINVVGSGSASNEYGSAVKILRADLGTGYTQTGLPTGRFWLEDAGVHGPIGIKPNTLNGNVLVINNYYNGSPNDSASAGMWITTIKGGGPGTDATHAAANTYAVDVGLGITGVGNDGSNHVGFTTGIQIGGSGSPWNEPASLIGTGIHIRDFTSIGLLIDNPSGSPSFTIDANTGTSRFSTLLATATATIGTQGSTTGAVLFKGTSAGTVTLSVADTAGTWTMKLPTTAGTSGYSLTTDGSGNTTWTNISASGANTALSNLASVAINTTLLPGSDDGAALGNATHEFSDLFLASGGVINWANGDVTITHATNTLTFAGAASGYQFDGLVAPIANDGAALGNTSLGWSDLFVASGAVLNFNNGNVTVTHSAGILTVGGSATNGVNLTLAAGGTSRASLTIPVSTLTTTASQGDIEADATNFYGTTDAGNRGIFPVVNFIRQHADRAAFATGTAQQAIFDSVANGTLTLETGAYQFECMIQIKGMSGTSGNLKFSLAGAGGASLASILYATYALDNANDTGGTNPTMISQIISTQTATNIASPTAQTVCTFYATGSFEVTGGGTIIPSVAQTTSVNTAVTTAGSYFTVYRMGVSTVVSMGQWS